MSKITKATFKSFLKKNPGFLIKVDSMFDGMTDCVENVNGDFHVALPADRVFENNLGFQGIWLVGGGRDYFTEYNKNGVKGIEVYNCVGSFVVGVKA